MFFFVIVVFYCNELLLGFEDENAFFFSKLVLQNVSCGNQILGDATRFYYS